MRAPSSPRVRDENSRETHAQGHWSVDYTRVSRSVVIKSAASSIRRDEDGSVEAKSSRGIPEMEISPIGIAPSIASEWRGYFQLPGDGGVEGEANASGGVSELSRIIELAPPSRGDARHRAHLVCISSRLQRARALSALI